jgi:hypothetical protein
MPLTQIKSRRLLPVDMFIVSRSYAEDVVGTQATEVQHQKRNAERSRR